MTECRIGMTDTHKCSEPRHKTGGTGCRDESFICHIAKDLARRPRDLARR